MSQATEEWFRKFLLLLSAVIFAGTVPELIFTEHTETTLQWIPFILCGIGFLSALGAWWQPTARILTVHRVLMILIALGGLYGVYEHFWHNYLFEAEIRPNATTMESLGRAFFGSSPLMAPGILTLSALLGGAGTYRHPKLVSRDGDSAG